MSENPPMAGPAAVGLERHLRHSAFVDPDRRQGTHRAHAAHQSLVERHVSCDRPRPRRAGHAFCGGTFDVIFDFVDHRLVIETSDGRTESFALKPMAVADFYAEFMQTMARLGIGVHIWTMPCEIENAIPFDQDRAHAEYDPAYVRKFLRALVQADRVMNEFRARFIGKASPVHFFWGSFDLAVTRFSGRTAPPPKGVTPNVAGWVMAEAYSHEVSSCGFWPGNGGYGRAAFYVYAYPEPAGYGDTRLQTPVPSTTRISGNSYCPMTLCGRPVIRTRCFSDFCRRLTQPPPIWRNGIARRWSGLRRRLMLAEKIERPIC